MRPGTEGKKELAKGGRKGDSERRQPEFSHWADPQESAHVAHSVTSLMSPRGLYPRNGQALSLLPTGFLGAAVTKTPRPDCVHL